MQRFRLITLAEPTENKIQFDYLAVMFEARGVRCERGMKSPPMARRTGRHLTEGERNVTRENSS